MKCEKCGRLMQRTCVACGTLVCPPCFVLKQLLPSEERMIDFGTVARFGFGDFLCDQLREKWGWRMQSGYPAKKIDEEIVEEIDGLISSLQEMRENVRDAVVKIDMPSDASKKDKEVE